MARKFTVIWAAEIIANDEEEAAITARRTIADIPYNYFDVYERENPYTVRVANDNTHFDSAYAHVNYLPGTKTNQ